ncbi:hypothetical protein [Geminisphaera colitermitum]|uniref:hypothetical protein n=1 Tax=Geminisphaera colitermitum TaxID=1148786 RepID=UPI001E2FC2AC|nr:hypothetical protein [Geminisphaera colitermitum]
MQPRCLHEAQRASPPRLPQKRGGGLLPDVLQLRREVRRTAPEMLRQHGERKTVLAGNTRQLLASPLKKTAKIIPTLPGIAMRHQKPPKSDLCPPSPPPRVPRAFPSCVTGERSQTCGQFLPIRGGKPHPVVGIQIRGVFRRTPALKQHLSHNASPLFRGGEPCGFPAAQMQRHVRFQQKLVFRPLHAGDAAKRHQTAREPGPDRQRQPLA